MSDPVPLRVYKLARDFAHIDGASWSVLTCYRKNRYIEKAQLAVDKLETNLRGMVASCPAAHIQVPA